MTPEPHSPNWCGSRPTARAVSGDCLPPRMRMVHRCWRTWCLALAFWVPGSAAVQPQHFDLVKGEPTVLEGKTEVTFWTDPPGKADPGYKLLPPQDMKSLADGARIQ